MSHKHFCDVAGHEWECDENTCLCMCGVLMEDGGHSECPIELLACPEHDGREAQTASSAFADALQGLLGEKTAGARETNTSKQPRKKLKKGTVISTWKDDKGQWRQDVVVKDTAKGFKAITQKIDPPSDEDDKAGEKQ